MPFQFFDRDAEYRVTWRRLPHREQAGVVSYITWRTWDSMPKAVLQSWLAQRDAWLEAHGIDSNRDNWREQIAKLAQRLQDEFHRQVSDRWESHLDECHGGCVLRRPELGKIVADSLRHFDGERYELTNFVVMPNHVHLLVAFPSDDAVLKQCRSWKKWTATQINQRLARRGEFWQEDGFDHLVRSEEQFEYYRLYIADNPRKARLRDGEYVHYQRGPVTA